MTWGKVGLLTGTMIAAILSAHHTDYPSGVKLVAGFLCGPVFDNGTPDDWPIMGLVQELELELFLQVGNGLAVLYRVYVLHNFCQGG